MRRRRSPFGEPFPGDNGQNPALVPGFLDQIAEKLNNRLRECLEFDQWLLCAAIASVVLWCSEVTTLAGGLWDDELAPRTAALASDNA